MKCENDYNEIAAKMDENNNAKIIDNDCALLAAVGANVNSLVSVHAPWIENPLVVLISAAGRSMYSLTPDGFTNCGMNALLAAVNHAVVNFAVAGATVNAVAAALQSSLMLDVTESNLTVTSATPMYELPSSLPELNASFAVASTNVAAPHADTKPGAVVGAFVGLNAVVIAVAHNSAAA